MGKARRTAQAAEAYQDGQSAGAAMAAAVQKYLDHRLPEVSERVLAVLRGQLKNIHNEPGYRPADVARVEFKIFLENIEDFDKRLLADTEAACAGWFEVAATLDLVPLMRELALQRILDAKVALAMQGADIAGQVIIDEEGKLEPPFDLSHLPRPSTPEERAVFPNIAGPAAEDRKRKREKWNQFAWFVGFSLLEIGVLTFTKLDFDHWRSRLFVFGAVFFPAMAVLSYFDARGDWSTEKSDHIFSRAIGWILGGPILLVGGLCLIIVVFGWLGSIPSWAAVIIVLLIAILFQLRRRS